MSERNITSVDLLESVTNKTNAIVEENGTLNKVNLHNEFNTINTKIDNEVNTLSNNIAQLSNPNLLINSDFRRPVNQRNGSPYGGVVGSWTKYYSIDRWYVQYGVALAINNGYITLANYDNSNSGFFSQLFEKPLPANDYTVTIKCKNINGNHLCLGQTLVNGLNVIHNNGGMSDLTLVIGAGSSIDIEYIKLEQGSIATPFVPRPYAEELVLCKRFYQKFSPVRLSLQAHTSGKLFFRLPFECEMRVTPSVSMDSSSTCALYKRDGWTRVVMFSLANVTFDISTTYVDIMCAYSSSFVDAILDLIGGYIHADAEIY